MNEFAQPVATGSLEREISDLHELAHSGILNYTTSILGNKEYIYENAGNYKKIHLLVEGFVRLGTSDEEGRRITKDIIIPGEWFGQLVDDQFNMDSEFAQALSNNTVIETFYLHSFLEQMNKNPGLALRYSKKAVQRMRKLENRMASMMYNNIQQRLLLFFGQVLFQDNKNKNAGKEGKFSISLPMTHQDIGDMIGASRQAVTTALNGMRRDGILSYSRNELNLTSQHGFFSK